MTTALVWFRRDLRLADNPALYDAVRQAQRIVPVYIDGFEAPGTEPGGAGRWWQHHALAALSADLQALGAPLLIRRGEPLAVLRELAQQVGATVAVWNRLYEPAQDRADRRLAEALIGDGLRVDTFNASLVVEPWDVKTQTGGPYRVYTPFSRTVRARGLPRAPLPAPTRLDGVPGLQGLSVEDLGLRPTIAWDAGFAPVWTPGERGAHQRLERFCAEALAGYADGRDRPDRVLTSMLSPHLHFGDIGPVQVLSRLQRALAEQHGAGVAGGAEVFEREIYWREFAHHVLFHFPQTPVAPMDPRYAAFPWREPADYADDLRRWQRGQTGVPIIDAGMRQLWTTGWMHNRVRMIVSSYLVKNLLIPWQEGAAWFWDTLLDADQANNTLGWQWIAGSGADAAPYFRVFNPVTQSQKFDPDALYIQRWVPEIARLGKKSIHAPWMGDPADLARNRLQLGHDYPMPSVDLGESRGRALKAFGRLKAG